jgi:hypothetical protein
MAFSHDLIDHSACDQAHYCHGTFFFNKQLIELALQWRSKQLTYGDVSRRAEQSINDEWKERHVKSIDGIQSGENGISHALRDVHDSHGQSGYDVRWQMSAQVVLGQPFQNWQSLLGCFYIKLFVFQVTQAFLFHPIRLVFEKLALVAVMLGKQVFRIIKVDSLSRFSHIAIAE